MGDLHMARGTLKLTDDVAVKIQSQPGQPLQNGGRGFGSGPRAVCVLNAQQEFPTAAPGIEPVKERSARPANVQKPCGRGGETGDDRRGHRGRLPFSNHRGRIYGVVSIQCSEPEQGGAV